MNNELFFDSDDFSFNSKRRPSSGPKTLDEIFNADSQPSNNKMETLYYVPSKPSKVIQSGKDEVAVSWRTLMAKIVNGYKNGESVGRVGLAFLKNAQNKYRVLVYRTKTNLLGTYTVPESNNVPHIHRQNSYWQFYDDDGFYWSILFERSSDETDFMKHLRECEISVQLDVDVNSTSIKKLDNSIESMEQNETCERFHTPENHQMKQAAVVPMDQKQYDEDDNEYDGEDEDDEYVVDLNTHKPKSDEHFEEHGKLLIRLPNIPVQPISVFRESTAIDIIESRHEIVEDTTSLTIVGDSAGSELNSQYSLPIGPKTSVATSSSSIYSRQEAQMMQLMLVENRTQNAELRINIDKLETKIEKVIDKIGMLHKNEQSDDFSMLQEQVLLLKKENRRLKREANTYGIKNETSYENIRHIYGSELNNLGIHFNSFGKSGVETIVSELIDKVTCLQVRLEETETHLKNVSNALKNQKDRNHHDMISYSKQRDELEQALRKIERLEASLESKREKEMRLNEHLNELKSQHATQLTNVKVDMTETLKDIMNTLYHNLAQGIVGMEKLLPDKILALIGRTIRKDTLSAVAKISK